MSRKSNIRSQKKRAKKQNQERLTFEELIKLGGKNGK